MDVASEKMEALKRQIAATENELQNLKKQLAAVTLETQAQTSIPAVYTPAEGATVHHNGGAPDGISSKWPLSPEEYKRYGRQMIVPDIGNQGQLRLKATKVLLIGAGGLGCPAAAYIAGSGVDTLGLVDGDEVETSNLHRQILHSTERVGMKKVDSAAAFLKGLNPHVKYVTHPEHLTPLNAEEIVSSYDLVLDCTDHPTSRYLISDICILLQKPLISASALRTEGQLIVLNSPPLPVGNASGGPCYRCVFPKPPPAESVVSCGDGGILGPVVGVMGVLQAVEAIKLITSGKLNATERAGEGARTPPTMLIFSANSNPPFRSLKMRSRRAGCFACSAEGGLTLQGLKSGSLDYVLFCGITAPVNVLRDEERVDAIVYAEKRRNGEKHLLVDVREKVQFDICSLEGSVNIPFSTFAKAQTQDKQREERPAWIPQDFPPDAAIYTLCRLGNDSQVVAKKLLDAGLGEEGRYVGDIRGGLKSWKAQVDENWPDY